MTTKSLPRDPTGVPNSLNNLRKNWQSQLGCFKSLPRTWRTSDVHNSGQQAKISRTKTHRKQKSTGSSIQTRDINNSRSNHGNARTPASLILNLHSRLRYGNAASHLSSADCTRSRVDWWTVPVFTERVTDAVADPMPKQTAFRHTLSYVNWFLQFFYTNQLSERKIHIALVAGCRPQADQRNR